MPAIPYEKTGTTNAPWDSGAARTDLKEGEDASYYRQEFAWVDPNADATTKGAYKFPHHQVSSDGTIGDANIEACRSAIAVLNGGMGGSQIPAGDHEAVYEHLAHHLKDAGLTPAPLKNSTAKPNTHYRITTDKFHFRAATDDQPATVSGHAAVFNTLSPPLWDLGGARERIMPGAFAAALQRGDDTKLLINHDPNLLLARSASGTLQMKEDATGLYFEAQLGSQSYAQDLAESMRRGDINQCSFAFIPDDASVDIVNGEPVHTVRSVTLSDCSIVTYPAYPTTDASVRSHYQQIINDLNKPAESVLDATEGVPLIESDSRKRQIKMLELGITDYSRRKEND